MIFESPKPLEATFASAQPPAVSSTKWLTMDLDQADAVGELKVEFILEVGCKKQGFEPKIIQIKWVIQEKHLEHLFLFFALRYFSSF